jgi:RimJ/RimL family protein N-acetyltransferase
MIQTPRLKLRQWQAADYAPFAAMSADPTVMEYFPNVLTSEQSHAFADQMAATIGDQGWGFWAVEILESGMFAGFVGLNQPAYPLPFAPCIEVGWRLATAFWGQGYATEAGNAALNFAFSTLKLAEVVSFTALDNGRSQAVMQRLGMQNTGQNFDHPMVPEGDRLRDHVLYRITQAQWAEHNGNCYDWATA